MVLAGGGTGGHFYPALAVAEALREREPDIELRYIGSASGPEGVLALANGMTFDAVSSGQIRGKSPLKVASSLFKIGRGSLSAARLVAGADAVFTTGGYASVPVVTGAWLRRVPTVVFLPDVEPGWAVRATLRLARKIAVSVDAATGTLPTGKTEVTGYPVRKRFFELDRTTARKAMALPLDDKIVLISGASTGSQRINDAVTAILPELLKEAIVIHSTGPANFERQSEVRVTLDEALRERYRLYPLIDDMPAAMHAADVGIMRAGASVLGELPAAGLPSVLIPGTFAGGHQRANALALEKAECAVIVEEGNSDELLAVTLELLNDEARLLAMRLAAKSLARSGAANALASLVIESAEKSPDGG